MSVLNFDRKSNMHNSFRNIFTTTFEKVIEILRKTEKCLLTYGENDLSKDIIYVIDKIQTNSLYSYNIEKEADSNIEKEDELKSIYESLIEYSENKKTYENFSGANMLNPKRDAKVRFKTFQVNKIRTDSFYNSKETVPSVSNKLNINHIQSRNNDDYKPKTANILEAVMSQHTKEKNNENEDKEDKDNIAQDNDKQLNNQSINNTDRKHYSPIRTNVSSSIFNSQHLTPFPFLSDHALISSAQATVISKDFNIHKFYLKNQSDSFLILTTAIFKNEELFDLFEANIFQFNNFIDNIRKGYQQVPYHNEKHGIDVCVSVYHFIHYAENFREKMKVDSLEIMSLFLAALCHDMGHPGYNNTFHMNSLSSYAITYNDKSVLENYHSAESMKILLRDECNFLESFDKPDFKKFRKFFIESILATDMTFHAKVNSLVKNRLQIHNIIKGENVNSFIPKDDGMYEAHQDLFNFILHIADISHNTKPFEVSLEWVNNLSEEFWIQGDLEKSMNLQVSFLCDRLTADVPKSQIGFLNFIILPSFDILIELFPNLSYLIDNINGNIEQWKLMLEKKESEKEAEKEKEKLQKERETNPGLKSKKGSVKIVDTPSSTKHKVNFKIHFASIKVDEDNDESLLD